MGSRRQDKGGRRGSPPLRRLFTDLNRTMGLRGLAVGPPANAVASAFIRVGARRVIDGGAPCGPNPPPWVRAFHSKSRRAARPLSSWERASTSCTAIPTRLLANRRRGRAPAPRWGWPEIRTAWSCTLRFEPPVSRLRPRDDGSVGVVVRIPPKGVQVVTPIARSAGIAHGRCRSRGKERKLRAAPRAGAAHAGRASGYPPRCG
jgi:hypothetical protein